jgi:hypothetical protein
VLLTGAAAAGATGCGGAHPRPAALRLERTDLVRLAHTLRQLESPAVGEVGAARAVWPTVAGGLPARVSPAVRRGVRTAQTRATALVLPRFVATEGALTGPAAKLGGMLKAYVVLTQRGWEHLAGAVAGGRGIGQKSAGDGAAMGSRVGGSSTSGLSTDSPAASQFLRANSGLYIYCVYDGHYDLSLIGKALQGAYHTLGGAPQFGAVLTQGQVEALARAYSIPATRLAPHPAPSVTL